LFFLEATKDG